MEIEDVGLKDTKGKVMLELVLPECIIGMGEVLTQGAEKYKPNSWQNVENGKDKHYASAMRHIFAWRQGEMLDKESKLPHLHHAMTNLMFCLYHDDN